MRLFVAVELDAPARDALVRAAAGLARTEAVAAGPSLKWVAPAALHLTLRFIGEVDAARGARVMAALEAPFALAPFDVTFAGAGAFPPRGAPRVLWAGVAEGADRMVALAAAVERRVREAGEPAETRPFTPHLTLARARDRGRPVRGDALRETLARAPLAAGPVRVASVTLFESRLTPRGPDYTPRLVTPLEPPRPDGLL